MMKVSNNRRILAIFVGVLVITVFAIICGQIGSLPFNKKGPFDGERAYLYLKEIHALGPRPAGSSNSVQLRHRLSHHIGQYAEKVHRQPFEIGHPISGKKLILENMIFQWHSEIEKRVLIGTHYDTRPTADNEKDPIKRRTPYPGTNDGSSGVAVLMELATHITEFNPSFGIDFIMFDGEDFSYPNRENPPLGARFFSHAYKNKKEKFQYRYGVIIDMVCAKEAEFYPEEHSVASANDLIQELWKTAATIGASAFKFGEVINVEDDHIPLIDAGIPSVLIMDSYYPHWHLLTDTPDKCSSDTLQSVGKVLLNWLASLK